MSEKNWSFIRKNTHATPNNKKYTDGRSSENVTMWIPNFADLL